MKTTLLTILTVTMLTSVEAKEVYKTYLGGSKTCYVYFFGDNNYEITILSNSLAIDIVLELIISSGNYHQKGDKLFLHDNYIGYDLQFKKHEDKLIPIKSFIFLKNKSFEKPGRYESIGKPLSQQIKLRPSRERLENISSNTINEMSLNETYSGTYGFKLHLTKDYNYKYWFSGLLVSEGKWINEESILRMKDAHLNESFLIVIKNDNQLCSLFSPDSESISLYKDYFPQPWIYILTETLVRDYKEF